MAVKARTKGGLLPGYFESLQQKESKERYLEKLKFIEGRDLYEISRKKWIDDVDCLRDLYKRWNISSVYCELVLDPTVRNPSKKRNKSTQACRTIRTDPRSLSEDLRTVLLNFASKFFI